MSLKNILKGWDFILATIGTLVALATLPAWIGNEYAKDLYEMGISVLSIVFAVFFTALAVIIAAGDDDFVMFLKEVDLYPRLVGTFRFTLWALFVALSYSVAAFTFTVGSMAAGYKMQGKSILIGFVFLFGYGLFATVSSTHDALNYSRYRLEFLDIKRRKATPPADPPPSRASGPAPPP